VKKYLLSAKTSVLNAFEYRSFVISSILMHLLGVGAIFFLWNKLIRDYTTVGNYNLTTIMTYYLLTGLFIGFFSDRTAKNYDNWIRSGGLSFFLVKPIKVILHLFFKELGSRIGVILMTTVAFALPIIAIPSIRNTLVITPSSIFWLICFSVLSNLFLYLFFWTIGSLSFWMVGTGGIRNIIGNLIRILRGSWFPLDLAPMWFQNILALLPFQYAMFYPIKILTDPPSHAENIKGLAVLGISILVFALLAKWIWDRGVKRFDSVGN